MLPTLCPSCFILLTFKSSSPYALVPHTPNVLFFQFSLFSPSMLPKFCSFRFHLPTFQCFTPLAFFLTRQIPHFFHFPLLFLCSFSNVSPPLDFIPFYLSCFQDLIAFCFYPFPLGTCYFIPFVLILFHSLNLQCLIAFRSHSIKIV